MRWSVRAEDGTRKYRARVIHGTRKQAEVRLAQERAKASRTGYVEPSAETIAAYMKRWLPIRSKRYDLRPSTVRGYESVIRAWIEPQIGKRRLRDLTPRDVQALEAAMLNQGKSRATVERAYRLLATALSDAVKSSELDVSPMQRLDAPRGKRESVRSRVWSAEQVQRFLRVVEQAGEPFSDWFRLSLYTGMRRSEVAGLRWQDVSLDEERGEGAIRVEQTVMRVHRVGMVIGPPKSRTSRRTIVLDATTVDLLAARRRSLRERAEARGLTWVPVGYVFANAKGEALDSAHASRAFTKLVRDSGLPHQRLHDLRHLHATTLLERGAPDFWVSRRLGHSTITLTVDTYGASREEYDREALARLGPLWHTTDHRTEPSQSARAAVAGEPEDYLLADRR